MNKRLQIPLMTRAAITDNSYNETDRTIEVVFATETEVKRKMWDGTRFIEKLLCQPENVRLERINSGANLVDTHSTYSVRSIFGVVVRAWVEGGECKATVRLSEREEVKGIVQDIISGIIRNISVGYAIHAVETEEDTDTNMVTVRVTDWEPGELSVCSVPADHNSGTRSQGQQPDFYEVNFENQRNMTPEEIAAAAAEEQTRAAGSTGQPTPIPTPAPATVPTDETAVRTAATNAERERFSAISTFVRSTNVNDSDTVIESMIKRGITLDQARSEILDQLITGQLPVTRTHQVGAIGAGEGEKIRSAMEEVLVHRANPSIALVSDQAKELRHATLLDMATMSLNTRGIVVTPGSMSKDELVKRALSSTDYPLLLGNTVNRSLRAAYEAATPEWRKFARKVSASDFKAISSVGIGGDFKLKKLAEGGEYKEVNMVETGDSFKLDTYGRLISITRRAIINDDLGGFMRYAELFGRGAAELQADIVYALFTANSGGGRKLSDGKNLFHADHKNLGTAAALSVASLTAARVAMRRQKGLTDEKILVRPRFLAVPPELETLAYQLITAETANVVVGEANPFKGAFDVIVDPYLESPTSWYLIADPATIPVVEYAFLNGQEGLYTEQEVDFNTDNLNIKVRTDFAATIEEHRGVYKNPGA